MRLLVGLGNPGPRHERDRHNIGFMAVDEIVRRHGFGPYRSKFDAELAEGVLGGERVLALKPQTFMNLSGDAVAPASRFYKIASADIVVLHDELDLKPGKLRVKRGGGAAGHNGLRSIDARLGTADYWRVRLGIGHPGHKDLVAGYVLRRFDEAEANWLSALLDAVAAEAPLLGSGAMDAFMSRVAARRPESET